MINIKARFDQEGRTAMKVYRGFWEGVHGGAAVFVQPHEGVPYSLSHQVRHSPTGLGWGDMGSGAADLARSILADHLGFIPSPTIYQEFKRQVVANWVHGRSWVLSSDEIERYLDSPQLQTQVAAARELRIWEHRWGIGEAS